MFDTKAVMFIANSSFVIQVFEEVSISSLPTFCDFIKGGCELGLMTVSFTTKIIIATTNFVVFNTKFIHGCL